MTLVYDALPRHGERPSLSHCARRVALGLDAGPAYLIWSYTLNIGMYIESR